MKIGGKTISNWWLIGGAGGLAVVLYLYKRSSGGGSSSPGSSAVDPVTGLPYSQDQQVDPATGMTYAAEAAEYGSVSAAEAAVSSGSAYGLSGGDSGYAGTAGYPTENVTPGSSAGSTYATNAAWAQAVQAGLAGLGYDAQTVASALGLFLAGSPLSADQAQIIQAAEAEFGPPPQGTYSIIAEPSAGTGGAGSGGTPVITGTGSGGTGAGGGKITTAPAGFRVVSVTGGDNVNLAWDAVPGATGYVIAYGPTAGSQKYKQGVGGGATTAATVAGVGAGSGGTHYFELWATPAPTGGPHAATSVTLKKS